MDKAEPTRDLMNVDSFSQLPFIRPAPPREKPPVRLFGIEVHNSTAETDQNSSSSNNNSTALGADPLTSTTASTDTKSNTTATSSGNRRKFECHYCCRNFPTSQALGGHQNAHKRERQHAKRAYLQSAAMLHPSGPADHLYGYQHHRLGPSSTSSWINSTAYNYHNALGRYYPSSSNSSSYPSSHAQHHHRQPPPINGSPLAVWRLPTTQPHSGSVGRDVRSLLQPQYRAPRPSTPPPLPVLGGGSDAGPLPKLAASQSSQRYVLEGQNGAFQDHLSLDLQL